MLLRRLREDESNPRLNAHVATSAAAIKPSESTRPARPINELLAEIKTCSHCEALETTSFPSNDVKELGTPGHGNNGREVHVIDGATVTTSAFRDSEAKEAPQSLSTETPCIALSSNIAEDEKAEARTTGMPPGLQWAAAPHPFRLGYRKVPFAQKGATWSPDGKCVLTSARDDCLRTHVLFRDEQPSDVHVGVCEAPSNIRAFAPTPIFNTEYHGSMQVVASLQDQPLRLFNVNDSTSKPIQQYQLMHETDDVQYIPVVSMKFTPDGLHFICGGLNTLAVFDINRRNPLACLRTHRMAKRKNRLDPYALSGYIMSFDYRHDGLLAAGTTSGKLGFYEDYGEGEVLMTENLPGYDSSISCGIEQLRWSPDGNLLYISRKQTNYISILDIRFHKRTLASLDGRPSNTNQRMEFDLIVQEDGYHVVAGGCDGVVRVWENPFVRSENQIKPDLEWKAHDGKFYRYSSSHLVRIAKFLLSTDIVANVAANPVYGGYLATTAGSMPYTTEDDYNTSDEDGEHGRGDDEKTEGQDFPVPPGWMKVWSFMD
ncbi:hypothetical protein MPH_03568 [Macrophomina phaseolina MS6]|uniref:Uncharacterized protein n=1 Tax=Macrophomina phaseolina (strain MS6) TaxID=1126212 RepID=K2RWQ6_MACPH|nr:hypothetical protein MPH_03568 [Macrophomina phaseolina MS6]